MSKRGYDKPIAGHDYDGIQELNNPLPRWWLATFYGTIIFAVIYFGYYELGKGPSHDERLAMAMASIHGELEEAAAEQEEADAAIDVDALLADDDALAAGRKHFETVCMACHGMQGEGGIGPNLTDRYWIHSRGDMEGLLYAIRKGFPEKGMPPWEAMIPAEDHPKVAAYVMTLLDTDPPNAKEPQGELVDESAPEGKAMEPEETAPPEGDDGHGGGTGQ